MNMKWEDPKSKYLPERIGEFDYRAKKYFPKKTIPQNYLHKDYSQMSHEFQSNIVVHSVDEKVNVNLRVKVKTNSIEMDQREAIINFAKGVMAVDILNKYSW